MTQASQLSPTIQLANLQRLVALHEAFWNRAAQRDPKVAAFVQSEWEPWTSNWFTIAWPRVSSAELPQMIREQSVSLNNVREHAQAQGIAVPSIVPTSTPHHEPAPRPTAPPAPSPSANLDVDQLVAQLNRITNERFWDQTGYKRGKKLSRRDPEDRKMIPIWLDIRYKVAQEQAAATAQGSPGPVEHPDASVGADASGEIDWSYYTTLPNDQLLAFMDEVADQRYAAQTGYQGPRPTDRHDPHRSGWLKHRFQVAREVALSRAYPKASVGADQANLDAAGTATWIDYVRSLTAQDMIAEIDNETDRRYAAQTGYQGPRPDLHDRATARRVPGWRNIRFQIAREVAYERDRPHASVGLESGDPWRVMESSPPMRYQHVPAPYYYESDFVGAEPAAPKRNGLLAQVAPVLAPGTGGFTAKLELDGRQHLHAMICVDGKCHRASMDLAPAIRMVMEKIAHEHAAMHANNPNAASSPAVVSGEFAIDAVDEAVGAAGDEMVKSLLDRHMTTVCGGWLDDIGGAIKGAGSAIYEGVSATAKKLKGPITAVAVSAATAAGGPAAGMVASQLVGPLIDKAAGKGGGPVAAALDVAEQAAKTNPEIAAALKTAQESAAKTIAAYHVSSTAKQAAAGNTNAQQQVAHVAQSAERGDPAAQAMLEIIRSAFSTELETRAAAQQAQRGPTVSDQRGTRRGRWFQRNRQPFQAPSSVGMVPFMNIIDPLETISTVERDRALIGGEPWNTILGADADPLVGGEPWTTILGANPKSSEMRQAMVALRKAAQQQAMAVDGNVVGVVLTSGGKWMKASFDTSDQGDDWFGIMKHDPSTFAYAAYFEKGIAGPATVSEAFGTATPRASVSGEPWSTIVGEQPWVDIVGQEAAEALA